MTEHVLITGGCGFVGTNFAERLLREGRPVRVLDDLSRAGVERNLAWLRAGHGDLLRVEVGDVRDAKVLRRAVRGATAVYHLAVRPFAPDVPSDAREDFLVNAYGTVSLLEALRALADPPPLLFLSSAHVYGEVATPLQEQDTRYAPRDPAVAARGIDESQPVAPRGVWACSIAAAERHVMDYAHTAGLRTVVLRAGCVYGPRQQASQDSGWVASMASAALQGRPTAIPGDGKRVRDLLWVDDLVDACLATVRRIDRVQGRAFNVGGGPANTASALELLARLGVRDGLRSSPPPDGTPAGGPRWYASDVRSLQEAVGWTPTTGLEQGLRRLHAWLSTSKRHAFARPRPPADSGEVRDR